MQQWQLGMTFNERQRPRQQAEVQQSRIQHLEQLLGRLQVRQQDLFSEASSFQASPAEEEMATIQALLSEAELACEALVKQGEDNSSDIQALREQEKTTNADYDQARTTQQALKGRQVSLETPAGGDG